MRLKHVVALAAVAFAAAVSPAEAAPDADTTKCVGQSYGEFGWKTCASTEDSCMVYEYRWGGMEGTYTCYVSRP